MLQVRVAEIQDEDASELRGWLASLADRREDLRESYRTHGTRHELFLLVRTRRVTILIIVAEVQDGARAADSFLRSTLPIDVEFKQLVREISLDDAEVELLYDSSTLVDPGAGSG